MNNRHKFTRYKNGTLSYFKRSGLSLFGEHIAGAMCRLIIPSFIRKKMLAWWRNSLLSRHNISHIHNKYQRAISGNYKTLQEFSSRKQQHLSVPANPHTVIAPVSGFAISEQISNPEQEICLYAEKSTIKDLLEHPRLIDSFCPGVMVAHRIPHYESHRIHMPLSGSITAQITTDYNGGSKTFLVIETAVHTSLLLCILTRDFTQKAILTYNQNKNS